MKTPEILALLAASFPKFELTKDTIKAYSMLLADIPEDMLKAAALKCARKCTFFPSVHEIMEEVIGLRLEIEGLPALYDAYREVATARSYHTWSHPLVKQISYQLGWNEYNFPTDNQAADRAHFADAYKRAREDAVNDMITMPEVKQLVQTKAAMLESGENPQLGSGISDPRIANPIGKLAQSMRGK